MTSSVTYVGGVGNKMRKHNMHFHLRSDYELNVLFRIPVVKLNVWKQTFFVLLS